MLGVVIEDKAMRDALVRRVENPAVRYTATGVVVGGKLDQRDIAVLTRTPECWSGSLVHISAAPSGGGRELGTVRLPDFPAASAQLTEAVAEWTAAEAAIGEIITTQHSAADDAVQISVHLADEDQSRSIPSVLALCRYLVRTE